VAVRIDAPLFYANSAAVEDRLIAITERERPAARRLELVLDQAEIDVEAADMLRELGATLAATGTELRLTSVRPAVAELLRRARADAHVRIEEELGRR
jgi:MFS superfamily sulfate permease-like transporter